MKGSLSTHTTAVLQALLVTFLWSTSWVLIKFGLEEMPPLTFGGLRYTLAFLFLLFYVVRRGQLAKLRHRPRSFWIYLIILGILLYTVTQGTVFLGLYYLPAITLNLILSFTSVLVALAGIVLLRESPSSWQWFGVGLSVVGVLIYFFPVSSTGAQAIGLLVAFIGLLANATSAVLGRHINHNLRIEPTLVTLVSMGVGGITLLIIGASVQGFPLPSSKNWIIVIWLALVNSAFAFTLWNRTLQTLAAMESSVINTSTLVQIPILAWIFLGERPSVQQFFGMLLVVVGILLVQLRLGRRQKPAADQTIS